MCSYSPERGTWAKRVQDEFAVPIYREVWPKCRIEEVDKYAEKSERWRRRDYSGLDKIIVLPKGNEIHLAQRFRSNDSGSDFSLRYKTPNPKGEQQRAEYFKLIRAYRNGYWRPDLYAFGKTRFSRKIDPRKAGSGFSFFYIFRVDMILKAHLDGRLDYEGPYPNKDGSSGVYFQISDFPHKAIYYARKRENNKKIGEKN